MIVAAWAVVSACVSGVHAYRLCPFGNMQHAPSPFPVNSGINFLLPHTLISAGSVTYLPLGFLLASASQYIWSRYIYLSCVVPSYVFLLLAPGSLPLLDGLGFVVGLLVG